MSLHDWQLSTWTVGASQHGNIPAVIWTFGGESLYPRAGKSLHPSGRMIWGVIQPRDQFDIECDMKLRNVCQSVQNMMMKIYVNSEGAPRCRIKARWSKH